MSLDNFLPKQPPKPVEQRCDNPKCRKVLGINVVKYELERKGKKQTLCQTCAKALLRPQEETGTI
jgi:hypothetical protein